MIADIRIIYMKEIHSTFSSFIAMHIRTQREKGVIPRTTADVQKIHPRSRGE